MTWRCTSHDSTTTHAPTSARCWLRSCVSPLRAASSFSHFCLSFYILFNNFVCFDVWQRAIIAATKSRHEYAVEIVERTNNTFSKVIFIMFPLELSLALSWRNHSLNARISQLAMDSSDCEHCVRLTALTELKIDSIRRHENVLLNLKRVFPILTFTLSHSNRLAINQFHLPISKWLNIWERD